MKKYIFIRSILVAGVVMLGLMIGSCKKSFDLKPYDELAAGDNFKNIKDADKAVMGIYGQVIGLANQYEILNELRGDLMDVTPNADKYLNDISMHQVKAGNPYADPTPFYVLINNCNEALVHFKVMLDAGLLKTNEYSERQSDITAVRCWLYLQHYSLE